MTETQNRTFAGLPINGDIHRGSKRTAQRPVEEFTPLLQALLDDPFIKQIGWSQYTPYFNDGDECIFSVHEPYFLTTEDNPEEGEESYWELSENYGVDSYSAHPTLGGGKDYTKGYGKDAVDLPVAYPETHARCQAFAAALNSGAFNNVVLDLFGDHAEIKITHEGIDLETVEHD